MSYATVGAAALLGGVLLTSVFGKTGRRGAAFRPFLDAVRAMRVVPDRLAPVTAVAVVGCEATICVLTFVPDTTRCALAAAAGLMSVFALVVAGAVRRRDRTSCACFGTASSGPLGRAHVYRNVFLAAVALAGALNPDGPVTLPGAVIAFLAGLVGAAVIRHLDDVLALFRPLDQSPTHPPEKA